VSAAVLLANGDLWTGVFGVRNPASSAPVLETTTFRVGSVTKPFVATLVMKLIDDAELSLVTTLATTRPEVQNAASITIRHLLNHTSGVVSYTDLDSFWNEVALDPLAAVSTDDIVAHVTTVSPLFAPGAAWSYSNTNYVLLGEVIESQTGEALGATLAQRIAFPLGLTETSYAPGAPVSADLARGISSELSGVDEDVTEAYHLSLAGPAGALVSTPRDMAVFLDALLFEDVVSSTSQDAMLTFVPTGTPGVTWGLGIGNFGGPLGHDGLIFGYTALVVWMPDIDATIAIASNHDEANLTLVLDALTTAVSTN
jgi:D-alanyl-D-alanine carboxypeptidase